MMAGALAGITILDLTRLLPGAVCSLLLADMGADVIKIEDPIAGDYARWTPPMVDGMGAFFRASNRNKRSMIINLKDQSGQAILHRLAQQADVLIEGFRPQVTERLQIDYATLKQINPRLIYCSLSGWGQDGPYVDVSGHDMNYISLNGLLGGMRSPQPLGGQIADIGGAYVGVMGITSALFQRERTGAGAYLDIALAESAMPFGFYQFVESVVAGSKGGAGTLTGYLAYYDVYTSKDGQALALASLEPKFWENFCHAVSHPEWIPDHADLAHQAQLREKLQALFSTRTADEWDALLSSADCCFTRVISPQEALDDPQIQARGMAGLSDDGVPWMRSPVRMNNETVIRTKAPEYGEHTATVLQEMGFDATTIESLHQSGAVGQRKNKL